MVEAFGRPKVGKGLIDESYYGAGLFRGGSEVLDGYG